MTSNLWRRMTAAFLCASSSLALAQMQIPMEEVLRRPKAPPMPHEATDAAWPQADYFQVALKLTEFQPAERWQGVSLRVDRTAPRVIVLPVQTQVLGFGPAFRALLGAQLDHALAARRIDSNRQTDVMTLNGPFVRRLDAASVEALAARHPDSSLLAVYVGHDGADTAFVTMTRRSAGTTRTAHRRFAIPPAPQAALASFAETWAQLLDELKLTANAVPAPSVAPAGCTAKTWDFDRPDTPATLACSALAIGTLLPDFEVEPSGYAARVGSPAKLAWLATAYVEGETDADPVRHAIADLAWTQLKLDWPAAPAASASAAVLADPVTGPVRKLLDAWQRSVTLPVRSTRDATQSYLEQAADELPGFARHLYLERGNQFDIFHRVALCDIEQSYPGLMPSARCRESAAGAPPAAARVGTLAAMLYQEWRFASYYKDIVYYGVAQSQQKGLAQTMAGLPADVAVHPYIVQRRFNVTGLRDLQGSLGEIHAEARTRLRAFVQASAEVQRLETSLTGYVDFRLKSEPSINKIVDDEERMLWVLRYDRYSGGVTPPQTRKVGTPAYFLTPGWTFMAAADAAMDNMAARRAAAASAPAQSAPATPSPQPLFRPSSSRATADDASLKSYLALAPQSMSTRVELAMRSLKRGETSDEARRWIDDYPADARKDNAIGQSHLWAEPAHAYFLSGELTDAARYYERSRRFGTGSGSELHADVRLRMIAGDIRGALDAAQIRVDRYPDDYGRRDLAAFHFMTGRPEAGWALITPRLAASNVDAPWVGALVGHRVQHHDFAMVRDWGVSQSLDKVTFEDDQALPRLLFLHAVMDRLPNEAELVAIHPGIRPAHPGHRWRQWGRLLRMAQTGQASAAELDQVKKEMQQYFGDKAWPLLPWYAWAAVHAGRPDDPELAPLADVPLATGDFSALLGVAMLASAQGGHAQAIRYLRAARHEIASISTQRQGRDLPLPMAYQAGMAGYLMFRESGHDGYRVEALQVARDFQGVTPYAAWTYALQALLERDAKRQALALCRARALDADSYFLSLVKPLSAGKGPTCRNPAW